MTPPPAAPDATLPRGTALGRFVVLSLVGRGAMGEVYAAYDPDLDRKIAIKLVRARTARSGDTGESRVRLMREAQATAKISHPNVVVVYDAGTFEDRVFIAMEFVEGHTVRYWLQAAERTWPEILAIFVAAGRGLAAAHDKDLVHRDFKPDNVMVGRDGQVRVMDFGLARMAARRGQTPAGGTPTLATAPVRRRAAGPDDDDLESTRKLDDVTPMTATLDGGRGSDLLMTATSTMTLHDPITQTGTVMGTPAYMSPEQFQSEPTDARSDQFSFCVALYESLYGERPFAGRTLDELTANVVTGRLAESPEGTKVPGWLRKVIERGLRVDPAARFPSMAALLAELDQRSGVTPRTGFASGAAAKLAGAWVPPVAGHPVETPEKIAMREAFLATGKAYADAAFAGASAVLDRFAARWAELYVEVLEATHVRGEQSAEVLDLRMEALNDGLEELKALGRQFLVATPAVVENAVNAAVALGTLERVGDVKLLRALVRPPEDPGTRIAVERIRARLVDVRALFRVGRFTDGLEIAAPLVEEARRIGYGPTLAEGLLVYGAILHEVGKLEASVLAWQEAVWTAELARHDEVAAEAASQLVFVTSYAQARFDVAEIWSQHAETLLRRMGGHDQLWGWFFNNRAAMREVQGRLAEALEDTRRAVDAKTRALGPDAVDVALSLGNVANQLSGMGDFDGAIAVSQQAVDIMVAAIGDDHPRSAVVLSNHGEFLCRLGRFAEAHDVASRALAVFERETDPNGAWVTYPLLTVGLSLLGMGRRDEAAAVLERATTIREALEKTPARLAEVHFALGRALHARHADAARAVDLVRRARREYEESPATPALEKDLAELDGWLAQHA
ncbi:MAG TPA: serine/threonine-protein kinase [Polyangia bacterium]|nr:serine/threonine-protein kinase [Polyangia bacterium]